MPFLCWNFWNFLPVPAPPTTHNNIRSVGQRHSFLYFARAKMPMKTFLPLALVPTTIHAEVQLPGSDCGRTTRVKLFPGKAGRTHRVISPSLERKAGPSLMYAQLLCGTKNSHDLRLFFQDFTGAHPIFSSFSPQRDGKAKATVPSLVRSRHFAPGMLLTLQHWGTRNAQSRLCDSSPARLGWVQASLVGAEQHPEDFPGALVLCSGCKQSALQLAASHGSDPGSSAAASLQLHQLLKNQLPFFLSRVLSP